MCFDAQVVTCFKTLKPDRGIKTCYIMALYISHWSEVASWVYQLHNKGVLARQQTRHNNHDSHTKVNIQVHVGMIHVWNGKCIDQTADE